LPGLQALPLDLVNDPVKVRVRRDKSTVALQDGRELIWELALEGLTVLAPVGVLRLGVRSGFANAH
jgi:hypothetical protein